MRKIYFFFLLIKDKVKLNMLQTTTLLVSYFSQDTPFQEDLVKILAFKTLKHY
jgi:hypothetical protein